jgi:hypothetical protein
MLLNDNFRSSWILPETEPSQGLYSTLAGSFAPDLFEKKTCPLLHSCTFLLEMRYEKTIDL